MASFSRVELALERMRGTRMFTEQFLDGLTDAEWFWSPPQYTTNIAWQVAHIAVSEYGLCIGRVRGRIAADASLISDEFIETFKMGSKPAAEQEKNPSLDEIRRVFAEVRRQAIEELSGRSDADLDGPLAQPHPRFKTKLGAVEFAALHEMVHAGQIAVIRRLMGKAPLR